MFLRRSLLNVPGHDLAKLTKALNLRADTLVLDLEDGVPLVSKESARKTIQQFVAGFPKNSKRELSLRINSLQSGLLEQDIAALRGSLQQFDSLILPKIETAQQIQRVRECLRDAKNELFICIESPGAIVHLTEICRAVDGAAGLVFGCEDYCAAAGISRTSDRRELAYVRSKIVNHAKAFGMAAIDMVCIDFRNLAVLEEEAEEARIYGFTGKQVIHPLQIDPVNRAFSPTAEQVSRAEQMLDAYKAHSSAGKGAFEFNGVVVDLPVILQARRVLEMHNVVKRG